MSLINLAIAEAILLAVNLVTRIIIFNLYGTKPSIGFFEFIGIMGISLVISGLIPVKKFANKLWMKLFAFWITRSTQGPSYIAENSASQTLNTIVCSLFIAGMIGVPIFLSWTLHLLVWKIYLIEIQSLTLTIMFIMPFLLERDKKTN